MIPKDNSFTIEYLKDLKSYPVKILKASKFVYGVTKNNLIIFKIDKPDIEEIKIPLENDSISNLFVDPSGFHVIFTTVSAQNYYYSKSTNKIKLLREAKGQIECIAWNELNSNENTTNNILVGMSAGEIIETKFTSTTGIDYWRIVTKFESKICNIVFASYPDSSNSRFVLIITTPTNLYPYYFNINVCSRSGPMFATEFERIQCHPEASKCTTFPVDLGYSLLDVFYSKKNKFPQFLSWLTGVGVYNAPFASTYTEAESNLFVRPKLLNMASFKHKSVPKSIVNTEFHVILQYPDCINFICTLNEELVLSLKLSEIVSAENPFNTEPEELLGISKDSIGSGAIICYTATKVFRINYDNETKNLWKSLLDLNNFDLALNYCQNDQDQTRVKIKKAEFLYDKGNFMEAAKTFAETTLPLEEVCLKFVEMPDKKALRTYLLEYSEKNRNFSTNLSGGYQNTYDAMCIWMIELFFEQINELFMDSQQPVNISLSNIKASNKEFSRFVQMKEVIMSLKRNKAVIYEKIKLYGESYQNTLLAEIIDDKQMILDCLIENKQIDEALKILQNEKSVKIHSKYSKKMIRNRPNEMINLWLKMAKLDIRNLLPAIQIAPDEAAKRFVKHVILNKDCRLEEVHNLYVLLCIRLAQHTGETEHTDDLLEYLRNQGNDPLHTRYDPQLALRNCTEWQNLDGSIFLLCLLNKHQSAVELALSKKKFPLAKEIASQFSGDDEIQKNLWLQIAKYIILENENIEEVCNLLEAQSVLKLEDILPFLPDSVKIEHFRKAICSSLDHYNKRIEDLKQDMKISTEYANKLREEFNQMKQKSIIVPENSPCVYCKVLLTSRPFVLFRCNHFFHIDCLEKVVEPMLDYSSVAMFVDLQQKMKTLSLSPDLKKQYYDIIASDCCYCGSIAIDNIDVPVIGREEFTIEMERWRF